MSATRDPDRIFRAWLEQMPDEAPDRAIAAVLQQTGRTSQRPRWTFPERWLPVDTTLSRPTVLGRHVPVRSIALLVVLAALIAAAAMYVGSRNETPAPYGPARNGQLVFGMNGDLYVADSLTATPRLLLSAPSQQQGVIISPDGRFVAYDDYTDTLGPEAGADPHEWVVNIDGSNPRQVLDVPYTFESFEWAPDSRSIAIGTRVGAVPHIFLAPADGSGAKDLAFESFDPWRATWDPQRPGVLLVLGVDRTTQLSDLYYVTTDGEVLQKLGMNPLNLNGPSFELSGATFSPDGKTIAYNAIVARENPVNRFRVHLMNRDGTNDREVPAPFDTNFSQGWPSFSPDGKSLFMTSWQTKPDGSVVFRLVIAPADGSATSRLVGPVFDSENELVAWSPDGTRILMCACDRNEVVALDPDTGDVQRVAWSSDMPGWQRTR